MLGAGIANVRSSCILHPASSPTSQRRHIDVVEIPLVIAHVLYLTLQSHDNGRGEIDAFETFGHCPGRRG